MSVPPSRARQKDESKDHSEPIASSSTTNSRLANISKAIITPFSSYKSDSTKVLSDLAPVLMTPKIINAAASSSSKSTQGYNVSQRQRAYRPTAKAIDFALLGRAPGRLTGAGRRLTSHDLEIVEATSELLEADIPEPEGVAADVSLLRGFNATIPSSQRGKTRRRKTRNVDTPHLGLKRLGMNARGLLNDSNYDSAGPEDSFAQGPKGRPRRGRESLAATVRLGREELERQAQEILLDKENLRVRRTLIHAESSEIVAKISGLEALRQKLDKDLLKIQEEELELDDECNSIPDCLFGPSPDGPCVVESVQDRLAYEETVSKNPNVRPSEAHVMASQSIRRKKGPAFLPSEHDELPPAVAFMTLDSHHGAITCLDFSEPYGLLVSASANVAEEGGESELEVVKCVQVEEHVCITGGSDSKVRLWDLRRAGESSSGNESGGTVSNGEDGVFGEPSEGPCVRVLEGHSSSVTSLFFEDATLVTGASDKTIRQWDLTTGQCVLTMDILWAISHPPLAASAASGPAAGLLKAVSGPFAVATPPYADGSWDMYQDFVGGLQFWGYALVSGSGDSAVRMWDMRTGQAHRTLMGHTGAVTCVQFDEHHIVSGSLDKTVRIWDLRTGGISDSIRFEYPVTSLQFDSRKVVACAGENGVKIYNRTTLQLSTLSTNGHTQPAERVRYMDRYMVSGGRDSRVKIWAI
ncbi:hypothetical protein BS47DRAFT_1489112 [Hydnum rufescens UP504]|uniref:Mitochondrial fission protein n=1 Tax=Hydnum rufescens UP504 TaxID=1448309 RepID=A0A9P6AJQ6_9AGAM|nr:hypothetical protein BS47DRAFT_1489112 [Hydnum rufescens UP504]